MKIAAIGADFPNRGGDGIRSPEGEPKASAIGEKRIEFCQAGNRNQFSGVRAISVGQGGAGPLENAKDGGDYLSAAATPRPVPQFSKNALSVAKVANDREKSAAGAIGADRSVGKQNKVDSYELRCSRGYKHDPIRL